MSFSKTVITLLCTTALIWANSFYANILFEPGTDTLSTPSKVKLENLIQELDSKALTQNSERVIITGFTDHTSEESNDSLLGYNRAKNVAQYIHEAREIPKNLIIIRGDNKQKYHILTVTTEGRRLNRRAEIVIKKVKQKIAKQIPLELNVVQSENCAFSKDSSKVLSGDTVTVSKGGFCQLRYGANATITLDENSTITLVKKKIVVIQGTVQFQNTDESVKPPVFSDSQSTIAINKDGAIAKKSNGSLFVSIYNGTGTVTSPYGKKSVGAMHGIAVLENAKSIVTTPLPTAPTVELADTLKLISGLEGTVAWNRSGETFHYRVSKSKMFDTIVEEKILNDTTTSIPSQFGTFYIQLQANNTPGFTSLWSEPVKVVVEKKPSLDFVSPFEDTLFLTSHKRPFSLTGKADPATRLYMNTTEIELSKDGIFSYDFMLEDDVNTLNFISLNPDSSRDTVQAFVLYTGLDEAIYVNDSIMGREAFTTSRYYRFRGTMPTATSLSINGEPIQLDENRYFEKRFKLPGYEKMPLNMEVSFENGHTKTINSSIERIEHNTPIQQALFSLLGIVAVSGLFVFIALQAE